MTPALKSEAPKDVEVSARHGERAVSGKGGKNSIISIFPSWTVEVVPSSPSSLPLSYFTPGIFSWKKTIGFPRSFRTMVSWDLMRIEITGWYLYHGRQLRQFNCSLIIHSPSRMCYKKWLPCFPVTLSSLLRIPPSSLTSWGHIYQDLQNLTLAGSVCFTNTCIAPYMLYTILEAKHDYPVEKLTKKP